MGGWIFSCAPDRNGKSSCAHNRNGGTSCAPNRSGGIQDILLRVIAAEKPPAHTIATEALLRTQSQRRHPFDLFCLLRNRRSGGGLVTGPSPPANSRNGGPPAYGRSGGNFLRNRRSGRIRNLPAKLAQRKMSFLRNNRSGNLDTSCAPNRNGSPCAHNRNGIRIFLRTKSQRKILSLITLHTLIYLDMTLGPAQANYTHWDQPKLN